jgi:hypothetical protein
MSVRGRKKTRAVDWLEGNRKRPLAKRRIPVAFAAERLRVLGSRLFGVDVVVHENAAIQWTQDEILGILSAVLTDATNKSSIQQVSIYGGRRPGVRHLVVAAHRVWPPPLNTVITIGKADHECQPVRLVSFPGMSCAIWFDNGYDYVYQFTAEDLM